MSPAARLAVIQHVLAAACENRRNDDHRLSAWTERLRHDQKLAIPEGTIAPSETGLTGLWRKRPKPADPLRHHLFDQAAGLLDALPPSDVVPLMAGLRQWDRRLADDFEREGMLPFEHACHLSPTDMQVLLRHTEKDVLVAALSGAEACIVAAFADNTSQRAWEMIEADIAVRQPSAKTIRKARARIVAEMKALRRSHAIGRDA